MHTFESRVICIILFSEKYARILTYSVLVHAYSRALVNRRSLLVSAGVHNEPGLERCEVAAAAVLSHSEGHFGRRARHSCLQVGSFQLQ